jgi:hypothetical protein
LSRVHFFATIDDVTVQRLGEITPFCTRSDLLTKLPFT